MAQVTQEAVLAALKAVADPDLGSDLVSLDLVRDLVVDGADVSLRIVLSSPATPHKDKLRTQVLGALDAIAGIGSIAVNLQADPPSSATRLSKIRYIIGVGAGKGGVGKSTVAVNLAVALAQAGAQVGLLDADIYGPSVPIMLGLRGQKPTVNAASKIMPAEAHGIRCISMGFMIADDMAVAWRGPMVGRAVTQFIDDVEWGELDYLIVDLPPGTGDIILSLCQAIPLSGALVVTTPQDVAFADVLRALRMFTMMKVEVLGLVENMSYFRCPDNGKDYAIFGPSHGEGHCAEHGVHFLGGLPIDMAVSPSADAGQPIVVAAPESLQAQLFREIAGKVASLQAISAHKHRPLAEVGKGFFSAPPTP